MHKLRKEKIVPGIRFYPHLRGLNILRILHIPHKGHKYVNKYVGGHMAPTGMNRVNV